jgi:uncharacterized protein YcgI (DUF1989 family)
MHQAEAANLDQILKATYGVVIPLLVGDAVTITNLVGNQVVDTWAIGQASPIEYSSLDHTRSRNSNIFFAKGMALYSNLRRPMLTLVQDTTPGRHDTLLCPCSAAIYAELGCKVSHRSCTDNFHEAIKSLNIEMSFTPASLNLFMNVPVDAEGVVQRLPPRSQAGDYVVLRSEMPLYLVLSSCPQDITPINGSDRKPTDLGIQVKKATVSIN